MRRLFVQRFWRFVVLLVLTISFPGIAFILWDPDHLTWARNAYGMAQVGAWEGGRGVLAVLVHWFFELKGRSLVSTSMLCAWIVCVWWWVRNDAE